jgi:hypothetical protein
MMTLTHKQTVKLKKTARIRTTTFETKIKSLYGSTFKYCTDVLESPTDNCQLGIVKNYSDIYRHNLEKKFFRDLANKHFVNNILLIDINIDECVDALNRIKKYRKIIGTKKYKSTNGSNMRLILVNMEHD